MRTKQFKLTGLNISTLATVLRNKPLVVLEIKDTKRTGLYYATVGDEQTQKSYRVFIASDDYIGTDDTITSAFVTASLSDTKNKQGFSAGWVTLTLRKVSVM